MPLSSVRVAQVALGLTLASGCSSGGGVTVSGSVMTTSPSAAGLKVGVVSGGNFQTVVANGDGTFEVTAVLLPYTAMVADIQLNALNVFEGLTTLHPVLTAPVASTPPFEAATRSATVDCQVTAEPGLTLQTVEEVTSGFITPLGDSTAFGTIAGFVTNLPPWTFAAEFGWRGPTTLSGDLYVLSHRNNTNVPAPPASRTVSVSPSWRVIPWQWAPSSSSHPRCSFMRTLRPGTPSSST